MSFISTAMAATTGTGTAQQGTGGMGTIIFLVVFFAIFYLLVIRPQSKKAKEHRMMINQVAKGDEVITSGGLLGTVTQITDNYITLELAAGVEVKLQKQAISLCLPKGTLKSI
jgi:preprotein translocase subunit YajC